jgi:hypothetical protein
MIKYGFTAVRASPERLHSKLLIRRFMAKLTFRVVDAIPPLQRLFHGERWAELNEGIVVWRALVGYVRLLRAVAQIWRATVNEGGHHFFAVALWWSSLSPLRPSWVKQFLVVAKDMKAAERMIRIL